MTPARNAIRGAGQSIGGAIGGAIYKAFPKQKATLDNIADFASKPQPSIAQRMGIQSYRKGGKVRETGLAYLHKGERVLNKKHTKALEEALTNKKK